MARALHSSLLAAGVLSLAGLAVPGAALAQEVQQAAVQRAVPKGSPRISRGTPVVANVHYADCEAVRAAGAAPLLRGQPGYSDLLDRDGDGVACDSYRQQLAAKR